MSTEQTEKKQGRISGLLNWIRPYLALFVIVILGSIIGVGALLFAYVELTGSSNDESISDSDSGSGWDASCNIAGLNLHGTLLDYMPPGNETSPLGEEDVTGSEDIVAAINSADANDQVKGILLEIDSPGGSPVAGEEIANALKASNKPSVAVIRQSGTSAAYWAATGARKIFASRNSDVGSIGVTMSYLENIYKDKKYVQLSSGKYKDTGDPDKPLSDDERQLLLRDVNIIFENFVADVATNRGIPADQVRAIADGSSVLGDKAKSLHLIDEIGSWSQAEDYLQQQIGEKPQVCW